VSVARSGRGSAMRRRDFEREPIRRVDREHRRRGRKRRRRLPEPRSALSREELAYEEARRRAAAKAKLVRSFAQYVVVVGVLALVMRPVAWVVGICWGIALAGEFIKKHLEPTLRQRWIDREVYRQLDRTVSEKRRELEGEHTRRIEEISASIAHEIRNPITAAKSLVQQMGEDPASPENVEYAEVALEELDRVEKSISHLLRFAREEEFRISEMRMAEVIPSAVETFRERLDRSGVEISMAIEADGTMRGDPEKLRRVIINLISNALDALLESETPRPRIEIQAGENLAGTEVWLRVRDNGPGIAPDRLQEIFSPFFTSKEGGTGLGLAISKKVVDAHGGSIEVDSGPGRGTEFVMTLPKRPNKAKA
jgi:signal transduction histidine kinase